MTGDPFGGHLRFQVEINVVVLSQWASIRGGGGGGHTYYCQLENFRVISKLKGIEKGVIFCHEMGVSLHSPLPHKNASSHWMINFRVKSCL